MKPDSRPHPVAPAARRRIERAHLRDPADTSHVMHRYEPPADLAALVQGFWVPVWSVPPGEQAVQKVLQHPVCLLVVTRDYARFYGVTSGLSRTTLTGDGWAAGVMCTPAAGALVAGGSVAPYTDRSADLSDVLGPAGDRLAQRVREEMSPDPGSTRAHAAVVRAYGDVLHGYLPVDAEGGLVDRLVALVEERPDLTRVRQVCDELGVTERALQRLVHRRIGLTPKWLLQRRRLHEAAALLRAGTTTLADAAATLGYADQPHFARDFARVTGMTPGEFAAVHARRPASGPGPPA